MSKTTSRTAETTLTIRGVVDLDYPKTEGADGDGEVEIRVRSQSTGLRITISMIVPVDGQDDDAIMEFAANVQHDDFQDLLGFEKTIRAMSTDRFAILASHEIDGVDDTQFLRGIAMSLPGSIDVSIFPRRMQEIADRLSDG